MLREIAGDGLGQFRRLLKTHLRQLHADVRVKAPLANRFKQLVINIGRAVCLAL